MAPICYTDDLGMAQICHTDGLGMAPICYTDDLGMAPICYTDDLGMAPICYTDVKRNYTSSYIRLTRSWQEKQIRDFSLLAGNRFPHGSFGVPRSVSTNRIELTSLQFYMSRENLRIYDTISSEMFSTMFELGT